MSKLLAVLAVAGTTAAASAGTITYSDTLALASTNWNRNASVSQWDPASFGVTAADLVSVTIKVTGTVNGDIAVESLDAAPAAVAYQIAATMNFSGPGGANGLVLPVANGVFNATAWDGNTDFGGTSGASFTGLTNTQFNSASPFIFAPYIGTGNVLVNVIATGSSGGSGAGNLIQQFSTDASALVEITYVWNEVPTPGAAALLGLGGLLATRRRRA